MINASWELRNNPIAAAELSTGSEVGKFSVHKIVVLAHAFLSCHLNAANRPTLSNRVGRSCSVMRRVKSMAEPRP